ncbi:uncharacterized protein FOMMEDRAFT_160530 [Fomitiporia mediterranea MF3/22]|uniref:uncharacterized protein n=1 Tax=Fomitiporia mediterranea (strain MF3/22) TaxID=694068 RepID=UPI0004408DB1|nr:uncharacterized protein FOMMEDRAFT_160530 [Fomitiporia mediterranea MF3/22]EJC99472.1 hypothetical protein FOMMEDRAFT_160530 [Fomitiporia mediterranea MF3/22]
MKLARAFLMFGAPNHRLPAQIQARARARARAMDMELSCITSNIKLIRQGTALSLGKLQQTYDLYWWKVIHDEVGVGEASRNLDALMQQRQPYSSWQLALFGGLCSAAICQVSFAGSFIDALISFLLSVLLVVVQILSSLTAHSNPPVETSSQALSDSATLLCMLSSSASGSPSVGRCTRRSPTTLSALQKTTPAQAVIMNTGLGIGRLGEKELLVTVLISCLGWTCNHFSALKFPNRSDVSSAIGAFVVGFVANIYGWFFSGNAFVIMALLGVFNSLAEGVAERDWHPNRVQHKSLKIEVVVKHQLHFKL